MKKLNILFVCKHNMFRSKVAEACFRKLNKNKEINVASSGIIKGYMPLEDIEVRVTKELGINILGKPKGISIDLLKKQDLIIIVADDVPKSLFNNREYINKTTKIIKWKITDDLTGTNIVKIKKIIKQINKKVNSLVKQLEEKSK